MKFSIRSFQFAAISPKSMVTTCFIRERSSPPRCLWSGATKSSIGGASPFRLTKSQSCHVATPHRHQPVLSAVEAGRHRARVAPAEVGGDVQRTVEPVGP